MDWISFAYVILAFVSITLTSTGNIKMDQVVGTIGLWLVVGLSIIMSRLA